jgi:integrase/recombinase XerD
LNPYSSILRVLARHREGPLAEARERFLTHCAEQGLARETLLRTAREVLIIAKYLDLTTGKAISIPEIKAAAERWGAHQRQCHRLRGSALDGSRHLFIQRALLWLGFLGRLERPDPRAIPFADLLEDFAAYMRHQRGLSAVTVRNRCWHVGSFLDWFSEQDRAFADVSLGDVDAFLRLKAAQGWSRVSLATSAQALRAFFRHAEVRSWCAVGFAAGIEGPRVFKQEGLPVGPTWPEVERLLAATRGEQPREIRDHAILLLFALYAFRSGEVAALRLEDLHWEREVIAVVRPKQRRAQEYPLVPTVGEAILRYLRQVRPRCARRELFLTLKAPFRPLSAGGLYHLVSSRLSKLNIQSVRHGPHALRHACASHLLAEGFSLKVIGDHLGHRSAYATRTYARVDLAGLRAVADFDLGGLL